MINYYYEMMDNVSVMGKTVKYLGIFDVVPDDIRANPKLHEHAFQHSLRWWLENANGVTMLVRRATDYTSWEEKPFDAKEFMWIKLQTKNIYSL